MVIMHTRCGILPGARGTWHGARLYQDTQKHFETLLKAPDKPKQGEVQNTCDSNHMRPPSL